MVFRNYSIDIPRQINRLLPFYMRGRKTMLFLHAICSPLSFFNDSESGFSKYAHEQLMELSMTAQKLRLTWYLNNVVVTRHGITLREGQCILINDETVSAAIAYLRREVRDQSTAPLFYPNNIPTVTRMKSSESDKAKAGIVTRMGVEPGGIGGRFTITVPYSGNDRDAVSRKISSSISRFIPVGVSYRIAYI